MNIQLLRADITSMKVDAIVAPTDPHAEVEDGRAIVLSGGNLLARFVIQVPMPHGDDADADEKLSTSTSVALARADELAVASIGLPPLPRSRGFGAERAARIMLGATLDYRTRARSLQRATFCLFGREEYEIFSRILQELER